MRLGGARSKIIRTYTINIQTHICMDIKLLVGGQTGLVIRVRNKILQNRNEN